MATKDELEGWIKEPIWVVYSLDTRCEKKLDVAVGFRGFRVRHGKEIVYEGPHMTNAIEVYEAITKAPDKKEQPKLDD